MFKVEFDGMKTYCGCLAMAVQTAMNVWKTCDNVQIVSCDTGEIILNSDSHGNISYVTNAIKYEF